MIFDRFICIHMRVYTDMAQYVDVSNYLGDVLWRHFVAAGSVWRFRCAHA